jgi:hypothetical protein
MENNEGGSSALQAPAAGFQFALWFACHVHASIKGPRNGHGELALGLNVKTLFHYDNNRLQYPYYG